MKGILNRSSGPKIFLIATLVSCPLLAVAQSHTNDTSQNPPPRRARAELGAPGPGAFAGPFGPGAQRLMQVLTEEQRASFREAIESQREKMRDLQQKLRDVRKALFEAGLTQTFDEEAVRSKAMEAAKLDAEMTVLRAKALSQIKPPLSAEQIEKLKNSFQAGSPDSEGAPRGRRSNFRRDQNDLPLPTQPAPPK